MMKFIGQDEWVNKRTGEVRTIDEFERTTGRTERFMITYLAEIISLIDSLGNQKMKVVKYLLTHMDKSTNTLIITTKELAKKSDVGYNTVIETLKTLDAAGIIQRRTGAVMINPRLVNNKRASGEATMMVRYSEFQQEERTDTQQGFDFEARKGA